MDTFGDGHRATERRSPSALRNSFADGDVRELRSIVIEFDEQERADATASRP